MKLQANCNYKSDDVIMTPLNLARLIVNHFKPSGSSLEPCRGSGNFTTAMKEYDKELKVFWCEINEGKCFYEFDKKVEWIITNPPWSKIKHFLNHSLNLADNVCFLITINHLWTKHRLNNIKNKGFGIKEIVIFDTPRNFPPLGFQVGVIYLKKGYIGDIKFSELVYEQQLTRNESQQTKLKGVLNEY